MRTYDLSPLWRSTIGFDHVFNLLDDAAHWSGADQHYPPYNIERTGEDRYGIALALAGFAPADIAITAEQDVLTIEGTSPTGEGNISIGASRALPLSGSSSSPTMSKLPALRSRMGCSRSTLSRGTGGDEAPAHCHQRQRRCANRRSEKSRVKAQFCTRRRGAHSPEEPGTLPPETRDAIESEGHALMKCDAMRRDLSGIGRCSPPLRVCPSVPPAGGILAAFHIPCSFW